MKNLPAVNGFTIINNDTGDALPPFTNAMNNGYAFTLIHISRTYDPKSLFIYRFVINGNFSSGGFGNKVKFEFIGSGIPPVELSAEHNFDYSPVTRDAHFRQQTIQFDKELDLIEFPVLKITVS